MIMKQGFLAGALILTGSPLVGGAALPPLPAEVFLAQHSPGAAAPSGSNRSEDPITGPAKPPVLTPPNVTVPTEDATDRVVEALSDTVDACRALRRQAGRGYVIDCLATGYRDLARRLPADGAYSEVRAALDRVANELESIARSARDRARPRRTLQIPAKSGVPRRILPNITSVQETALAQANAAAAQAVEQGQLLLLRSTPPEDPRRSHYERVSAAFGDAAVLLRSQ